MRGDAFIHFVCGSRGVNIRLGFLLLIPKSPQVSPPVCSEKYSEYSLEKSYPPAMMQSVYSKTKLLYTQRLVTVRSFSGFYVLSIC